MHPIKNSTNLLDLFKKEIDIDKNSPENKPYSFLKPSILFYRIVFLTIGLIYFGIAFTILSKSLNWTCSLIFGSTLAVKTAILMICSAISAISFYFGVLMSTEKETVRMTIRRAKKKLKKLYVHKFGIFGLQRMFQTEEKSEKTGMIYQQFNHLFDQFDHLQVECIHLVERIAKSNTLNDKQKEELLNQAVIELRFKLNNLIEAFEQKYLPV